MFVLLPFPAPCSTGLRMSRGECISERVRDVVNEETGKFWITGELACLGKGLASSPVGEKNVQWVFGWWFSQCCPQDQKHLSGTCYINKLLGHSSHTY